MLKIDKYLPMNDQEIIDTLRKNDFKSGTLALKHLYKKNYHMIESYILKNNGSKEDAKDAFQDSIIVLYKNLKKETFVLNGKISSYLYSISRNIWLKKLRDSKITTTPIEDHDDSFVHDENILKVIEYTEKQRMIGDMLRSAGERCKKLLMAFYYEKLSMQKIASTQGYSSEQITKNQKVRCLKKIRTILSQSDNYFGNLENNY